MNKKSLAILLFASSFAGSTFATSIFDKLIIKHGLPASSIVKTHKETAQTSHPYTDFSGTWILNCGDGGPYSTPWVIENDADHITIDGDKSRIGQGLLTMSGAAKESSEHIHTSQEWNADGSELIMKRIILVKSNMVENSAILTLVETANLTMKNGQINMDHKMAFFEDVTQIEHPAILKSDHCVLSKVK